MKAAYTTLAFCLFIVLARSAAAVNAGPLERHLRTLRGGIVRLSSRSFVSRFPNHNVSERFTVTTDGYTLERFDDKGRKILQWSRKKNGQISYEAWYSVHQTKERMLEDDRTLSYTSFYRSGVKWEQYIYNKSKRIKAYYVYDKHGKLIL